MSFRKVQVLEFNLSLLPNGSTYTMYTVPQGHKILDVTTRITTILDGTPSIKIGDGTITDRFALIADITPGTVGIYQGKGTAVTGIAATGGVVVTPAAGLPVTITHAATGATAGAARVLLTFVKIV